MVYLEWFHPKKSITNIESNKKAFLTQHNWYYRQKQPILCSWKNKNTNTKKQQYHGKNLQTSDYVLLRQQRWLPYGDAEPSRKSIQHQLTTTNLNSGRRRQWVPLLLSTDKTHVNPQLTSLHKWQSYKLVSQPQLSRLSKTTRGVKARNLDFHWGASKNWRVPTLSELAEGNRFLFCQVWQ